MSSSDVFLKLVFSSFILYVKIEFSLSLLSGLTVDKCL